MGNPPFPFSSQGIRSKLRNTGEVLKLGNLDLAIVLLNVYVLSHILGRCLEPFSYFKSLSRPHLFLIINLFRFGFFPLLLTFLL
jgi:hypothetical protein